MLNLFSDAIKIQIYVVLNITFMKRKWGPLIIYRYNIILKQ